MVFYILCPSCGNDLGDLNEFYDNIKKAMVEVELAKNRNINPEKAALKPDLIPPQQFFREAFNLKTCCMMRCLGDAPEERVKLV